MNIAEYTIQMFYKNGHKAQLIERVNRDRNTVEWEVRWSLPDGLNGYRIFSRYSAALRHFDDTEDIYERNA